ncbi:MAG TPA: hypothetical protein VL737_05100 [Candidatus Pristimantibacillus sp.]|nr:hypothetical protein [Candidatus Pristimantibacillus sp.]
MSECDQGTIDTMGQVFPELSYLARRRQEGNVGVCVMELLGDVFSDDGGSACPGFCRLNDSGEPPVTQ